MTRFHLLTKSCGVIGMWFVPFAYYKVTVTFKVTVTYEIVKLTKQK